MGKSQNAIIERQKSLGMWKKWIMVKIIFERKKYPLGPPIPYLTQ